MVNQSSFGYHLLVPIDAKQVVFRYPKAPIVLDEVSCGIQSGSMTAILGPNGCGKSTLIRLLAGLRNPESGQINLDNQPIKSFSPMHRAKRIAFIEQRPNLAFDFRVQRVIEFGAHAAGGHESLVVEALERFELAHIASKPYGHLSVGQQQRVSIARAWVQISANPSGYLLADEPCSAMDPKYAIQTMRGMRELADRGIGVGVVIHDLTSAARWADHAIVLNQQGKVAAQGSAHEVLTESVLSAVFEVQICRHKLADGHWALTPQGE